MILCILGLTAVVGPCDPGFYCPVGSKRQDEILCPMGFYCPLATQDPYQCPNGTFSNTTGLMSDTQCRLCTPGMYCNGFGLIEPDGPCTAGIYLYYI